MLQCVPFFVNLQRTDIQKTQNENSKKVQFDISLFKCFLLVLNTISTAAGDKD
jgi:hypothetical protein